MICEKCGKEHDGSFGSGRFCSRACANSRIRTEEIRQKVSAKLKGQVPKNKGSKKPKKPKEETSYYKNPVKARNGDILDITGKELDDYFENHKYCEICGRTVEETVHYESKFKPRTLCIDHNHDTKKFRGLLCQLCNRQLGWYEKYSDMINFYLLRGK